MCSSGTAASAHMHLQHLSVLHPEGISLVSIPPLPADDVEPVFRRNASKFGVLLEILLLLLALHDTSTSQNRKLLPHPANDHTQAMQLPTCRANGSEASKRALFGL